MSARPECLAEFPIVVTLPIQWGDQDAFGHVNNTVFFRWYESARIAYFARVIPDPAPEEDAAQEEDAAGLILASIQCDFKRQVTFPDTVEVGATVTRIGSSSMTVEHLAYSQSQQAVVAEGTSTVLTFDYQSNKPKRVPDKVRAAIAALEGKSF